MVICIKCNQDYNIDNFRYGKRSCYSCQKETSRLWKLRNKTQVSDYNKIYKKKYSNEIKLYNKKYNIENRVDIQKRSSKNYIEKYRNDPNFKIAHNIRKRIRYILKNFKKEKSSIEYIGCTKIFLKTWFQYCFDECMTFENYGKVWHIDHVIPCSKFMLQNHDEKNKCFHWTNLKPMKAIDNIRKNNKTSIEEIRVHEDKINNFLCNFKDKFNDQFSLININRLDYI
jgi:hypothetical protein